MISEDQIDPVNDPAVFVVNDTGNLVIDPNSEPPALPLFAAGNLRSAFNKGYSLRKMLTELGIEIFAAVETWERPSSRLTDILPPGYSCHSVFRKKTTGGGCSVIFNDKRFQVSNIEYVNVPEGVETVWTMLTSGNLKNPAIYISPKSR